MIVLQQLINGVSLGSIYALIALGYTMVYGIILLINFAHGNLLMVGAYTAFFTLVGISAGPWGMALAFVAAMVVCMIFGVTIEYFAYRPLRTSPRLNALITAIAVSLILENGARVLPFVGPNHRMFPRPTVVSFDLGAGLSNIAGWFMETGSRLLSFIGPNSGQHYPLDVGIDLGELSINSNQIIVIILSALLMIALNYVVNHTKRGKAMQAVSFDKQAASLMGISVNRIITYTFAIGSLLAGAGGILYAITYPMIFPTMGMMPGLNAFVAAVLGGIGSIPGAMLGGFILGIAQTFASGFISSEFADAITFSILIIVLLFRPAGILGKKMRVKV
ncbi:MAG: branched-chain amino acid ABC transporter permease [Treponema sp.]|nr:branched-chain amino acid ABC transporter permease [Treponema sp.]